MESIPEELVEETWQEVAGFTPEHANKEIILLDLRIKSGL